MKPLGNQTIWLSSLAVCLIALAVSYRLLPHPANFTAVTAVALFGGAILPRNYALAVPLTAMIVSDLVLGLHSLILVTWGVLLLTAWLSNKYLRTISAKRVVCASFAASILFFVTSNFAVWIEGRLYPYTWHGLLDCYYMALPFFRNSLLGDILFSGLLFSTYALVKMITVQRSPRFRLATTRDVNTR